MNLNATLIIEVLSFLILLGILVKFLFKPLLNIIDKRSSDIDGMLKGAENSRSESETRLNEANEIIEKTKKEILEMKESSKLEADGIRKEIIEKAKKEASRIMEDSKKEMDKEVKIAKKKISQEIMNFTIGIAEKVLKREIRPKDHQRLIDDSMKEYINE